MLGAAWSSICTCNSFMLLVASSRRNRRSFTSDLSDCKKRITSCIIHLKTVGIVSHNVRAQWSSVMSFLPVSCLPVSETPVWKNPSLPMERKDRAHVRSKTHHSFIHSFIRFSWSAATCWEGQSRLLWTSLLQIQKKKKTHTYLSTYSHDACTLPIIGTHSLVL